MYAAPPLPAPAGTPLHTARLLLRPYQPSDTDSFFQLIDADRARLRPSFPAREAATPTVTAATQVLTQFRHDWAAGRLYVLGIWHQETRQYLGDISLKPNWTSPVTAEIGYYLAAEAEGYGYAREALAAAVAFGFDTLHAARLLIRCQATNPRSCAVAEAAGFQPLPAKPRPWPLRAFGTSGILYYSLRRPA
ncbi:GNAT family N-acetyltransferase [Hymenobacter endophyticus]|uniref:GNAT family N-acetyltransferase n=1 Tax=Hymenobacter endophyticus TaxID=3076335 RepID=A0ABU3TD43_9BACT|nr:GNAT family N-acetyltransferase [Hymenobacter endophyticus]MDU0369280.1 GNAT family N-acetyltransferase [Hymenobacter endophyticus]